MATVTHTLYSRYDPKDRERLQRETGQIEDEASVDPEQQWRKEAAQIYPNRMLAPPRFVPAKTAYDCDSWGDNAHASSSKVQLQDLPTSVQPASMFSNLPRSNLRGSAPPPRTKPNVAQPIPTPISSSVSEERPDKNNWFIMKAIQSDSGSKSAPVTPTPTLADILAREPPPLPSEPKPKPPIWLALGPANKGFSMLQRSGWNEGETLGPYAARLKPAVDPELPEFLKEAAQPAAGSAKHKAWNTNQRSSSSRTVEVKLDPDISELKEVDVIDLTLSSESEDGSDEEPEVKSPIKQEEDEAEAEADADRTGVVPHGGKALMIPIATVLKADRMGIGLKPKTVAGPAGAYRIPQKRVTHNGAALAAHIRAGMELQRQKREQGRGRRAFARQKKQEAAERNAMLAYMNS